MTPSDMASRSNLRLWLQRVKPHALLAFDAEDEQHKIAITHDKKNRWATAVRAVSAVRALRVIAYNEAGEVLNEWTVESIEGAEVPGAAVESYDPTAKLVPTGFDFASVLATAMSMANTNAIEAADRAVARLEEAYAGRREDMAVAMGQFAVVTRMVTDRLVHLEKAWHSVLLERAATSERAAEREGDDLAMAVLERAFPVAGDKDKANGAKPNGAAPEKKVEPLT